LGPNGAGKTTLISILSGLLLPSEGNARVGYGGYDIKDHLSDVQSRIGVFPQFDVLWDDLNVLETLLFYCRLKGFPRKQEKQHVETVIKEVGLEGERRRLSKDLSGGQKRRLSLAISMTGNPDILFLDEPTSGLDPTSKRGLWDIIMTAKAKHSIILTTHSMEEADVLASRIGILNQGMLRTIGSPQHLKSKFGKGFKIQISYDLSCQEQVHNYIMRIMPTSLLIADYWGFRTYQIPKDMQLSKIFKEIESNKSKYGIKNWALSQSSLEEVFIDVVDSAINVKTIQ